MRYDERDAVLAASRSFSDILSPPTHPGIPDEDGTQP